jgi:hypothetical protein
MLMTGIDMPKTYANWEVKKVERRFEENSEHRTPNIDGSTSNMLCGKDRDNEQGPKNPEAVRLPLRHEMGERVGERWCSGLKGRTFSKKYIQQLILIKLKPRARARLPEK